MNKLKTIYSDIIKERIISPLRKGVVKTNIKTKGNEDLLKVDLSKLPKYISYKTCLIREKLLWQNVSLVLFVLSCTIFMIDYNQINDLQKRLREKEYIVLPDYIPVSPHTISDQYISYAVDEFISQLGNVHFSTISKQYSKLSENMDLPLRRRFEEEVYEWIKYVEKEKITEVVTCDDKEIYTKNDGIYRVTAICKKETYVNHDFIGEVEEVIELKIGAIPPKKKNRWVVQIKELTRGKKKTFNSRKKIELGGNK